MEIANDRFLVNGGVKVVGLSTDHRLSLAQSPIDDGGFPWRAPNGKLLPHEIEVRPVVDVGAVPRQRERTRLRLHAAPISPPTFTLPGANGSSRPPVPPQAAMPAKIVANIRMYAPCPCMLSGKCSRAFAREDVLRR